MRQYFLAFVGAIAKEKDRALFQLIGKNSPWKKTIYETICRANSSAIHNATNT